MQDEAGMASKPLPHLRVPVGAVVVYDQMQRNRPAVLPITHKFQPSKIQKILKISIQTIRFVMNLKSAS